MKTISLALLKYQSIAIEVCANLLLSLYVIRRRELEDFYFG